MNRTGDLMSPWAEPDSCLNDKQLAWLQIKWEKLSTAICRVRGGVSSARCRVRGGARDRRESRRVQQTNGKLVVERGGLDRRTFETRLKVFLVSNKTYSFCLTKFILLFFKKWREMGKKQRRKFTERGAWGLRKTINGEKIK